MTKTSPRRWQGAVERTGGDKSFCVPRSVVRATAVPLRPMRRCLVGEMLALVETTLRVVVVEPLTLTESEWQWLQAEIEYFNLQEPVI